MRKLLLGTTMLVPLVALAPNSSKAQGTAVNQRCLQSTGIYAPCSGSNPFQVAVQNGAGTGITVVPATPSLTTSITPAVCGSAASVCAIKTSGVGDLYEITAACISVCWLVLFNSTSAPTNGSTTAGIASGNLQECLPIGTGSIQTIPFRAIPEKFSSGIYAAISSTSCANLTLTSAGFIHALYQ